MKLHPVVLCAAIWCGCASTSVPSQFESLREINDVLSGRWAVIDLSNGQRLESIKDVRITPAVTFYAYRDDDSRSSLPTGEVASVAVVQKRGGAGRGALIGTAPGLFLIGMGVAAHVGGGGPGTSLATGIYLLSGVAVLPLGALLGAITGGVLDRGREVVIYEGADEYPEDGDEP